ncbi:hypothetical protein NONI108955_34410 [Nocardia ninae]|uniref:Transposase for insertion sequence element IS21-like C-terminal domain-containing protein n=2 Tax=Nocardia ninae TaxID=356145 RepID=A0A511MRU2_9NOCA|nr:hypothetical protein NN4_78440 [Nocardia ninae NBRC 108245]
MATRPGSPRAAYGLIDIAVWLLPVESRSRWRAEWRSELYEYARAGIPTLVPAIRILRGAPAQAFTLRAAARQQMRATASLPSSTHRRTWLIDIGQDADQLSMPDGVWRIPGHREIGHGDLVVVRDYEGLRGIAVAQALPDHGIHPHCPRCNSRSFENHQTRLPKYRCYKCGVRFEYPKSRFIPAGSARSIGFSDWEYLSGLLSADDLLRLRIGRRLASGVVELHSDAFAEAVTEARAARLDRYRSSAFEKHGTDAAEDRRDPPLCSERYRQRCKVNKTGDVKFNKQRISLGRKYRGKRVTVSVEGAYVNIYHNGMIIAVRPRKYRKSTVSAPGTVKSAAASGAR